jgi:uncharacterized protein YbjT (DUF2867 family)
MMQRRTIAVVGATGAQGGGLVRSLLADPAFHVRALTRDPAGAAARALAAQGAEVVAADLGDRASVERAFAGADGAYCVTFFWAHFSPEREIAEATNMAQAARAAGVRHVIWSTLEDSRKYVPLDDPRMPTLMGRYKVPHFDAKAECDAVFESLGVPTTYLLTSFYWENFIHFGMGPKRGPDGRYVIAMPMGDRALPGMAAEDIGRCAHGLLRDPDRWIGQRVGIAGEHLTGAQMAAQVGEALGIPVGYYPIEPDAYRALGFPGAEDLGNMFQFNRDFADMFRAARDVALSRQLNPRLQTLREWLAVNAKRIPLD